MDMIESLKSFGLNEKEAKVYLALLQLGKTTAYAVSTRSGLKKPTTYVILDQLIKKGFAFQIPRERKHLFFAESPDKCFALAREKLSLAQESLPELMAAKKGNAEKVNISHFEGIDGIKEIFNKLIDNLKKNPEQERGIVGFYAHTKDTPEELKKYWLELANEFRQNKITRKGLTPRDESLQWYFENAKEYGIDLMGLPVEKYNSNVSFEIYDKYVQIISHRYLQGTLIENRDVADALRQIFEIMWEVYKNKNHDQ
jgi:HTH-type transcriptional regulator, sugar sensing transcriptional regulator